jgi:DNA-binding NarL/FixJ family response regulator
VLLSTYYPKGFVTAAEQSGVEAILDMPCTVDVLAEQIRSALALNAQMKLDAALAISARRRRADLRPRVVIVDDSPQVLELLRTCLKSELR